METTVRIFVEFSGFNENDSPTKMFWTIINIKEKGEITEDDILSELGKSKKLSAFRGKREISIYKFIPF